MTLIIYDFETCGRREFCRKYNVSEDEAINIYYKELANYEEDLDMAYNFAHCGED